MESFLRAIRASDWRTKFWQNRPTLKRVFSAAESRLLWTFLRPHWRKITAIIVLGLLLAAAEGARAVAVVGLIKGLVASEAELTQLAAFSLFGKTFSLTQLGIGEGRVVWLSAVIALMLGFTLLVAGVKPLIGWLTQKTLLLVTRDVRERALDKFFTFDIDYFNQARSGELVFLMTAETNRFSVMIPLASEFITSAGQAVIFVAMLFYMDWELTVVILSAALFFFLVHLNLDMRIKATSWEANVLFGRLAQCFHETIYGIKLVKIGALEDTEKKHYLKEHKNFEKENLRLQMLTNISTAAQDVAAAVVLLLILAYIGLFRSTTEILRDPAWLMGYLFLLTRTIPSLISLQKLRSSLLSSSGPLTRVMALLQMEDGPDKPQAASGSFQAASVKEISSRNLHFSYNGSKPVLKDVNLAFRKGEMTALVGASGSGKSTLLDILSSLRKPTHGGIVIDGIPMNGPNSMGYKRLVGYMNQEPIIFHESVRDNVKVFKPNASDEEVWQALRFAAGEEFVKKLPKGLDTGLGERGWTVSGGERQRIGLARVFLLDAPILLLDEATNALDYRTEKAIYDNLEKVKGDKVIIVAAHRLTAIKGFDHIVFMERGQVTEQGTHGELIRLGMGYRGLFLRQAESVAELEGVQ